MLWKIENFIKDYTNDTQLLIAKVSKGDLLKISDDNSDKFTIIKNETNTEAESQVA